jgi:hypothetical protein
VIRTADGFAEIKLLRRFFQILKDESPWSAMSNGIKEPGRFDKQVELARINVALCM